MTDVPVGERAGAAYRPFPMLAELTMPAGANVPDAVAAARALDDADPVKRALATVPAGRPCRVHLFMRTPRYDKDGREVPVVLSRVVELGFGALRGWTPYYMTGDHQEIVVRYDAVARVLLDADRRCKLDGDGAVVGRESVAPADLSPAEPNA